MKIEPELKDHIEFICDRFDNDISQIDVVNWLLNFQEKDWDGFWNKTSIHNCRKGSVNDFIDTFKTLRSSPNLTKEVCLSVDFISKKQLLDAFEMLKRNESYKQKNNVIQMVWFLHGFISTCKELDLHCRIFCAE